MYHSPSYMGYGLSIYEMSAPPDLPSGKKYPLLQLGDTDASVEARSGIKGLVTWLNTNIWLFLVESGIGLDIELTDEDPDTSVLTKTLDSGKMSDNEWSAVVAAGSVSVPLAPRSTYDETTVAYVKAYQALRGLSIDGKVGKNTWSSMGYKGTNSRSGGSSSSSSSSGAAPSAFSDSGLQTSFQQHWTRHQDKYYIGGTVLAVLGAVAFALSRKGK